MFDNSPTKRPIEHSLKQQNYEYSRNWFIRPDQMAKPDSKAEELEQRLDKYVAAAEKVIELKDKPDRSEAENEELVRLRQELSQQ